MNKSTSPFLLRIEQQVRKAKKTDDTGDTRLKGYRLELIDGEVTVVLKNPEIMGELAAKVCSDYNGPLLEIEEVLGATKNGMTLIQRGLVGGEVCIASSTNIGGKDPVRHSAFMPIFNAVNSGLPQMVSWDDTELRVTCEAQ